MPRKLKSTALRSDAVTISNIPDNEITAAKLHTTAIQDKLGYTPASAATVASQISALVNSAPTTLDTLNELASALGNDASFATTVTNALAAKANTSTVNSALAAKADTSSLGSLATRNSVDGSFIDNGSISSTKLTSTGRFDVAVGVRNGGQSLGGDSGWNDHMSTSFTCGVACRILIIVQISSGFESGPAQGFFRILVDGSKVGYSWMGGKQSTANSAGSGSSLWTADVGAGSHTVMIQARNIAGGSTWITPYWQVDGEGANTLGVLYYA